MSKLNKREFKERENRKHLRQEHAQYFNEEDLRDWYKHPERYE